MSLKSISHSFDAHAHMMRKKEMIDTKNKLVFIGKRDYFYNYIKYTQFQIYTTYPMDQNKIESKFNSWRLNHPFPKPIFVCGIFGINSFSKNC